MDLGNPSMLFSAMLIGMVGVALLIYGKKQTDIRFVLLGIVLNIIPFVAPTVLALWGLSAGCCSLLYVSNRLS